MLHTQWLKRLSSITKNGWPIGPRGISTLEETDAQLFLRDSKCNLLAVPSRHMNYRFAVAEWLWMAFGRSDVDSIAQYNKVMRQFSDDGVFLTGAYGPHLGAQRDRILQMLKDDPSTRQAVIEILRPRKQTKDEPCTLSLQFLLRFGSLNLIATMRSSDAWLGIPYDVFSFTQIQNCFAGALGVNRGWLSLRMGSSHLYSRDLAGADECLRDRYPATFYTPNLPGFPPAWLEDVLVKRDERFIPRLTGAEEIEVVAYETHVRPWLRYAEVLLAPNSYEAQVVLARS